MNVLTDKDLEKYMSNREMYVTKEIVNSDFKTEFEAKRTYFIDKIEITWVSEDKVICNIYSGQIKSSFIRSTTKYGFYAEMKKLFIPISEMFEAWKSR
jgi:hypothetical protein